MKRVTMVLVLLTLSICMSGCVGNRHTTDSAEILKPQALCIVIGAHGNSQAPNFLNAIVQNTVKNAVKSNGYISVVCVDGKPDLLAANLYEIPAQYVNANKAKLESDAHIKAQNMLHELEDVCANDPESDVLASLTLAVRSLSDMDEMEKSILIIDTGISTTGYMDFGRNLIVAEPNDLAEILHQKSAIPNFEGITVTWLQMGDTAEPQCSLTAAQKENLTAIWQAIIEKSGGTFVYSDAPANPVNSNKDYPEVTPVDMPAEAPISFDVAQVEASDNLFREPQFISEEKVQFIGDSDEYFDEDKAATTIRPIADYMLTHPDLTLLLIGTTAGDETTEYCLRLSEARANAVKRTLTELGVPAERILALGLGSKDPWHIYGVGAGNDPLASANRKVVLIDASSETARTLLRKENQ